MSRKLTVKIQKHPCFVINRAAFHDTKLVYVARANKKLAYPRGRSKIAYIGTTKKGARRIASSAVWKGEYLLYEYGIKYLELYIVTCGKIRGAKTWRKLERALLIRFMEKFGQVPRANKAGKKFHWRDEQKYFSQGKLDKILDRLSK